jgi:hypothetical protein
LNNVWKLTALTIFTGMFFLTGCSPSDTEKQTQKIDPDTQQEEKIPIDQEGKIAEEATPSEINLTDAQKLQDYINEQNQKLEKIGQELDYYKQYAKDMILVLPSDKIDELINKEYNYSATINSIQFPQSGVLEIKEAAFDMVFTEERAKYSVLPETESLKGKLNTRLDSAVTTSASAQMNEGDFKTTLTFSYKDLVPGDTISIKIKDDLKKKLNINTNEIFIKVVK